MRTTFVIIFSLFFFFTNKIKAQQHPSTISLGMAYTHLPEWGKILPLATRYLSHKSLWAVYQPSLPQISWDIKIGYVLSGFNHDGRLEWGGVNPSDEYYQGIKGARFPHMSIYHQVRLSLGEGYSP